MGDSFPTKSFVIYDNKRKLCCFFAHMISILSWYFTQRQAERLLRQTNQTGQAASKVQLSQISSQVQSSCKNGSQIGQ